MLKGPSKPQLERQPVSKLSPGRTARARSAGKHVFDARSEFLRRALAGSGAGTNPPPHSRIAGQKRILNGTPDVPDARDKMYRPSLQELLPSIAPPADLLILDQGSEGACTGFALAAVVNRLNQIRAARNGGAARPASPRMLYELARQHDEWAGEDYQGSSIRGALKGFFHNGVCGADLAPFAEASGKWTLTVEMAKDARNVGLGAYYRLRPDIIEYHSALNEVGIVCASARVHDGWHDAPSGVIARSRVYTGGHAFAIVGYDNRGFFVQNSWGGDWGGGNVPAGVAHWSYEDWAENVMDAWVLRLSVSTPEAFDVVRSRSTFAIDAGHAERAKEPPRRQEIVGHVISCDDGRLQENGRYATPLETFAQTGSLFANEMKPDGSRKYEHVLFFAHGGLNSLEEGATRAAALIEPFKRNGIYPMFFLWGTSFMDEFGDALQATFEKAIGRVGGITDFTDFAIEQMVSKLGRAVWRQIKRDADVSFAAGGRNARTAVETLLDQLPAASGPKLHVVGHSAGAIFLGHMLGAMAQRAQASQLASAQLLAPACTNDFFMRHYQPLVGRAGAGAVETLRIYNLSKERELEDSVLEAYQKSLLYLVSNACEEERGTPLLGMQLHAEELRLPKGTISYSGAPRSVTDSQTHGGFDNDLATMNSILKCILGQAPEKGKAFEPHEVEGY